MAILREPAGASPTPGAGARVLVWAETSAERARLAAALEAARLQATASPGSDGGPSAQELERADIVVLACDVDRGADLASLRRLRRQERKLAIVAVSPEATGTGVRRALDAGADAVVFEPELESTLAVAVGAVSSGQSVVPRHLRATVERPAFSHREREVLDFVVAGLTNAQIANRLYLSESTVKSHLSSVFDKLGVRSRKEAAGLYLDLVHRPKAGVTS